MNACVFKTAHTTIDDIQTALREGIQEDEGKSSGLLAAAGSGHGGPGLHKR